MRNVRNMACVWLVETKGLSGGNQMDIDHHEDQDAEERIILTLILLTWRIW
jgi:hypothetical protein